jgi:bifunctional UDP-N-acetylglucosamine pyrophosphorylase/glucosamine-1-phosphate N-acetyltransferase
MSTNRKISTHIGDKTVLIMAGGSGTRMGSSIPKQLMKVGSKSMLIHLIDHAVDICSSVVLVLSEKNKQIILSTLIEQGLIATNDNRYIYKDIEIIICIQHIANGTGGAVIAAKSYIDRKKASDVILILSADVPLISRLTMLKIFDAVEHNNTECVILTKDICDCNGYGRIIENTSGFVKIVEHIDCTDEEKQITLINTGTYGFKIGSLTKSLEKLTNLNNQREYYLTDCPKIIYDITSNIISNKYNPIRILQIQPSIYDETLGVNTLEQLEQLQNEYLKKFTIEKIDTTNINLSEYNGKNITRILYQLSPNNSFDPSVLSHNVIKQNMHKISNPLINHKQLFVVKYENSIIGSSLVLIENKLNNNTNRVSRIESIIIDREYQDLGLAERLMQSIIEYSKSYDICNIIVNLSEDLKQFYQKLGFIQDNNSMQLDI